MVVWVVLVVVLCLWVLAGGLYCAILILYRYIDICRQQRAGGYVGGIAQKCACKILFSVSRSRTDFLFQISNTSRHASPLQNLTPTSTSNKKKKKLQTPQNHLKTGRGRGRAEGAITGNIGVCNNTSYIRLAH